MILRIVSVHPQHGEKTTDFITDKSLIWSTIQGVLAAYNEPFFDGGLRAIKNITAIED
jgi:hypothetical protein